ncbi:palmitoyltransferase ZDHHC12 [Anolis carolinensis]|uniref:palmitoyltransferase ZDHHC12 n=1 Tax=Anolis carolinensis TaxID=28377 RepID=UPI002F2B42DC
MASSATKQESCSDAAVCHSNLLNLADLQMKLQTFHQETSYENILASRTRNGIVLGFEDADGTTSLSILQQHYFKNIFPDMQPTSLSLNWRTWMFNAHGESKTAILFFYGCTLLWGYPTYLFWIIPLSFNTLWYIHVTFLLGNALMWFFFLRASIMSPGFLPRDTDEYYMVMRQVDSLNCWEEGKVLLSRLCHRCHLVKPLRAKHCHIVNRCVAGFDHYCPFIYNNVGYRNRPYFVGFLATMCLNSLSGINLCWNWFHVMGRSIFIGTGFLFLCIIAVISAIMTSMCVYMAAVNLTTTECLKPAKCTYLLNHQGKFFNPFDRGIILNIMEFFNVIKPLTENGPKRAQMTSV